MKDRIGRDLEGLDEEWDEIDTYLHNLMNNYKKESNSKNFKINKKLFIEKNKNENIEDKLIKNITCNFSIKEGKITILDNMDNINGTEIIGEYGDVKFIKNPPAITKVTNITSIYEILKHILSLYYIEWKNEYEEFDLKNKNDMDKLPYSWISDLRPTKRNIKNIQDNNTALNLIQKDYMNSGNTNINNLNDSRRNINNNINVNENENIKNNIRLSNNNSFNEEINENNNKNDHEISNMLSDILFEDNNNNDNNNNLNNNNVQQNIINNNVLMKDNTNENKFMKKSTTEILDNIQYQIEHPPNNIKATNSKNNKENSNLKQKKQKKYKKNKFKHVGTLNFDPDGLMVINLCNENDQKIEVMQSASKLLKNERGKNEEKKPNKKYIITLDNTSRRIQYIKEKTAKEKKIYDKKKEEMLQGINFDYLNSFKKLFETYPELNNLLETDQLVNQNKKVEQYKLDLKDQNNTNINVIGETNIQRENGPSQAMKLLLEVYGIPPNFLEENNPYIEYAKENGINDNFMFENIFKDIKSYINAKNSKRNKNLFQFNKKNNNININNNEDNEEVVENKENLDDDGDLIIESESEDNSGENNDIKEEKKGENSKKKNSSKNKESKHCVFDSKKINQITYIQSNINDKNEKKDEFGKLIEDINKKAEKGIKIAEKIIYSNYKGLKEHSFNKKNNGINENNNADENERDIKFTIDKNKSNIKDGNKVENINNSLNNNTNNNINSTLVINKSIELSVNKVNPKNKEKSKEKKEEKEEKDSKFLITNSKISTDIFMNALNYNNNDNNIFHPNKNNRDNSKKKKNEKLSNINNMKPVINSLSNSLSSYNDNNYYTDVALYSKSKKSKSKESKLKNISSNDDKKVNYFKIEKDKDKVLSNIKENVTLEREKSSKIENKENLNEKFLNKNNVEKSNIKNYNPNIGNIHDLDNFDDLFK